MNGIDFSEAMQREKYIQRGKDNGVLVDNSKDLRLTKPNSFRLDQLKLIGNSILVRPVSDIPSQIIDIAFLSEKYHKGIITKIGDGFTTRKGRVFIPFTDPLFDLKVGQKISFGNFYTKKSVTVIEDIYYFIIQWKDIEFIFEGE
jgi:co-chaperonin GroES (HSP10)